MLSWISQTLAVTALNLRTIPQRLGSSGVAIVGIAGVVVVLVSVLSIASGFTAAMRESGSPIARARHAQRRRQRDDERRQRPRSGPHPPGAGHPPRRPDGARVGRALRDHRPAQAQHRHAGQRADARHRPADAGRARQRRRSSRGGCWSSAPTRSWWAAAPAGSSRGSRWAAEVAVGPEHVDGGRHLRGRRRRRPKPRSGATPACCRAPTAAATPTSSWSRGSTPPTRFDTFRDWLTSNPQLNVQVRRETEYYAQQSRALSGLIRRSGFGIAALMGIGAVFGAILTMYTAVSTRSREIATLRALGFNTSSVVVSVLAESLALGGDRRRHRRRRSPTRLQRLPDLDDELPDLQPGGLRVPGHARRCW